MPHILDTIVAHKREELADVRACRADFGGRTSPRRPFADALRNAAGLGVVAEVKKASPSKGVFRVDFDAASIAKGYERGGAAAVSVLTDERFFQGSLSNLVAVRDTIALPVLRKEFIIDPVQVEETAHSNADAMLLIAAILSDAQMAELHTAALELGVEPLVEIHDEGELERAMKLGPELLGINNRDLTTFECSLDTTLRLVPRIPSEVVVVSESGIGDGEQSAGLLNAGVRAVLVGESLVCLEEPGTLIRELSHAG